MRTRLIVYTIGIIMGIVGLCFLLLRDANRPSVHNGVLSHEPSSVVYGLLQQVKGSMMLYILDFGDFSEVNNKTITQHLLGNNPAKKMFIKAKGNHINDDELIDPWGVPLKITLLNEEQGIEIRSAGANQQFIDDDDISLRW